jgi:hypothetical protein
MKIFNPEITPGPWNSIWIHGALRQICKNVPYDYFIDEENLKRGNAPYYRDTDDCDAISAVPELLDVLKAARKFIKENNDYVLGTPGQNSFLELGVAIDILDEKYRTDEN